MYFEDLPKPLLSFKKQLMTSGNSYKVELLLIKVMTTLKKKIKMSPFFFFFESIERVRFYILLQIFEQKKKRALKKVIIPIFVKRNNRYKKAILFLSKSIKLRKEFLLSDKISNELFELLLYAKSNIFLKKIEIYNYIHFSTPKSTSSL